MSIDVDPGEPKDKKLLFKALKRIIKLLEEIRDK